jgi:hypothetical protein
MKFEYKLETLNKNGHIIPLISFKEYVCAMCFQYFGTPGAYQNGSLMFFVNKESIKNLSFPDALLDFQLYQYMRTWRDNIKVNIDQWSRFLLLSS